MFHRTIQLKCKNRTKVSVHVFDCKFTIKERVIMEAKRLNPMNSYMMSARDIPLLGRVDPDTVNYSSQNMFKIFRDVFKHIREKNLDPDVKDYMSLKLRVINSRLNDAKTCLICWESITSPDCIVSTCCFATFCYQCVGVYSKRDQCKQSTESSIMIPTISPCCGCFTILPMYSVFKGFSGMTKCEKLRETIRHFYGANIVVYLPKCMYSNINKYIYYNSVSVNDVDSKSPFSMSHVVFIYDESRDLTGFNWKEVTVFIDTSELENPMDNNPHLTNIVLCSKIYYKLQYVL